MMNTFNITRFGQALKCQFLVMRKDWIRLFGIYTLVLFFGNLFFTRITGSSYSRLEELYQGEVLIREYGWSVREAAVFGVLFFCFAMLFGASYLFAQMKDTRKRSAYLLWPVSNLEKYVVSLIGSVLLMAVMAVCSYILADALRVMVDLVTGRVIVWGLPRYYDNMFAFAGSNEWQMTLMVLTWLFYIHSLFIVGGTLFRRYHFLLTSLTIAAVTILLMLFLKQMGTIDLHLYDYVPETVQESNGGSFEVYHPVFHTSFYLVVLAGWLLIAFHYWLSYKFFTRMQVINNKWLNV